MAATPRDDNRVPGLIAKSDADNTPVVIEADAVTKRLKVSAIITSGGGGGGASTIADGADVAEGTTTDAAVTAGSAGTISGKLRQISSDISTGNAAQATAAGQSTMNTTLSTIGTNTGNGATAANQTNGNQQTKLTDGTNIANVVANDTGFNGVVINKGTKVIPFTTSSSGVQTLLANTDTRGYAWITVTLTSAGSGLAWTGPWSATSGGTYVSSSNWQASNSATTSVGVLGVSTAIWYDAPVHMPYFQLAISALTSGTVTGNVILSTIPKTFHTMGVSISGASTVGSNTATGSAFPANAFGQGVKALTTSPTAATTGNLVAVTGDVMGEVLVTSGGLVTSSVPANAANVVVKATAGRLCRVLVTTTGVTAMQIFDNASTNSGTIIGALPASAAIGGVYDFEMPAALGITIAGSATNPAVTVSWI